MSHSFSLLLAGGRSKLFPLCLRGPIIPLSFSFSFSQCLYLTNSFGGFSLATKLLLLLHWRMLNRLTVWVSVCWCVCVCVWADENCPEQTFFWAQTKEEKKQNDQENRSKDWLRFSSSFKRSRSTHSPLARCLFSLSSFFFFGCCWWYIYFCIHRQ